MMAHRDRYLISIYCIILQWINIFGVSDQIGEVQTEQRNQTQSNRKRLLVAFRLILYARLCRYFIIYKYT